VSALLKDRLRNNAGGKIRLHNNMFRYCDKQSRLYKQHNPKFSEIHRPYVDGSMQN
jgi:hypothetical protein